MANRVMAGVDTTPIITVRRNMGQAAVNRDGLPWTRGQCLCTVVHRIVTWLPRVTSPATYVRGDSAERTTRHDVFTRALR
jgi:hypothetical protein